MTARGALAVIAASFATVVFAEVALWLLFPLHDPYATLRSLNFYIRAENPPGATRRIVHEPGLPGLGGRATVTFNAYGMRGGPLESPKPVGELRVFLVGGSVFECAVLDDDREIGAVLDRLLQAELPGARVYNAGRSGARTDDDVALVSARILHLEPDVLVFMPGVNDLHAAMRGHVYSHSGSEASRHLRPWRYAATELQLGRLGWYLVQGRMPLRGIAGDAPRVTHYAAGARQARAAPAAGRPPRVDLDAYRRNLASLVGMGEAHGVHVVFATQATTWRTADTALAAWHWMHAVDSLRFDKTELARALGLYNAVTRDIAVRHSLALFDAEARLPPSSAAFYDDMHFNNGGARLAAEGLAEAIIASVARPPGY